MKMASNHLMTFMKSDRGRSEDSKNGLIWPNHIFQNFQRPPPLKKSRIFLDLESMKAINKSCRGGRAISKNGLHCFLGPKLRKLEGVPRGKIT